MFTKWRPLVIFTAFVWIYWFTAPSRIELHPEHTCQAQSWLDGHWYLTSDFCKTLIGEKIEWPKQSGNWYIVHPPLAAVVMLVVHFLPIHGALAISVIIGALSVTLCYELTSSVWLTVLFALGTNFWYEASAGRPWGFTSILSCPLVFLELITESSLENGLWLGLASLTRYDLIGAVLPFWMRARSRLWFMAGLLPSVIFYLINAHEKFGGWYDFSVMEWYKHDGHVVDNYGPFSWHYLPWNIYTALYLPPSFNPTWPWIRPTVVGQSLLTTSPALVLALNAGFKKYWHIWLAIVLSMTGAMTVWSNGYVQFGSRYWIMVYPFLIYLLAQSPITQLTKILICLSVLFNMYGVWYINTGHPF